MSNITGRGEMERRYVEVAIDERLCPWIDAALDFCPQCGNLQNRLQPRLLNWMRAKGCQLPADTTFLGVLYAVQVLGYRIFMASAEFPLVEPGSVCERRTVEFPGGRLIAA